MAYTVRFILRMLFLCVLAETTIVQAASPSRLAHFAASVRGDSSKTQDQIHEARKTAAIVAGAIVATTLAGWGCFAYWQGKGPFSQSSQLPENEISLRAQQEKSGTAVDNTQGTKKEKSTTPAAQPSKVQPSERREFRGETYSITGNSTSDRNIMDQQLSELLLKKLIDMEETITPETSLTTSKCAALMLNNFLFLHRYITPRERVRFNIDGTTYTVEAEVLAHKVIEKCVLIPVTYHRDTKNLQSLASDLRTKNELLADETVAWIPNSTQAFANFKGGDVENFLQFNEIGDQVRAAYNPTPSSLP
jgi:hypothetical protein